MVIILCAKKKKKPKVSSCNFREEQRANCKISETLCESVSKIKAGLDLAFGENYVHSYRPEVVLK